MQKRWVLLGGVVAALLVGTWVYSQDYSWFNESRMLNFMSGLKANTVMSLVSTDTMTVTVGAMTVTADDTGNAEVALPQNSVGGAELSGVVMNVIFCGQNDENGTIYLGPATAVLGGDGSASYALSSAACDALDNATEATADAPLFTNVAFKVMGFLCSQGGTLGAAETITYTLRTAAADAVTTDAATTALTCTIAEAQKDCRTLSGTTTNIAAGATVAMKAVQASDNADDDSWCVATIALQ